MIEATGRPVSIEITLHECDSIAVDRIQQLFSFFLALTDFEQSVELLRAGCIKKNMKDVTAQTQKVRRAPAHDHATSGLGNFFHDLLTQGYKAVGVKCLRSSQWYAALVTPTQKNFDQPLKRAIGALLAAFNGRALHIGYLGDLLRQGVIPNLPAEPAPKLAGNLATPASVFAFDGDHPVH